MLGDMMERYIDKFNYLVHSGYDEDILNRYFYVQEEVISNIVDKIYGSIIKGLVKDEVSKCLIVGGQPGSGKSCYCSDFIDSNVNYAYVSLDNYRVYHPNYKEIREMILGKWGDDDGDEEKNPSSDLTGITHYFAVRVNDLLLERLSRSRYNILLEWNLRYAEGPIDLLEKLRNLGYINDIVVVLVPRGVTYAACKLRYELMKDKDRLARRVSKSFHDLCVDSLATSVCEIEKVGFWERKIINSICCILRNGSIVWKDGMDHIYEIIDEYLNSSNYYLSNDIYYVKRMYERENNKI